MSQSTTPMPSAATPTASNEEPLFERVYVWEAPIRLTHWVNALSLIVLFSTGLYIAHPVFTGSGEAWNTFVMGRVREVHFAAGYVFAVALALRFLWFLLGNEHTRSGIPRPWSPEWWRAFLGQGIRYVTLDVGAPPLGHNAMAGVSYAVFMGALGFAQILTGFALYSQSTPGGFWDGLVGWVTPLLGGVYNTAMWHHLFAWGFALFVVLHIYIVVLDSREYKNGLAGSIFSGYKFRRKGQKVHED